MRGQMKTVETSTVVAHHPVEAVSDRGCTGSSARVPTCNWRAHWLTVAEFSRVMGRRPQTIYSWINNGTLAEFGIPSCQFRHGRVHSGRVFILNIF